MAENSKIEWTHHTFNPWMGCTKVSEACRFCYAERDMDLRFKKVAWGNNGTRVMTSSKYWEQPLKWNQAAAASGQRQRVFCASLADVFEDWQGPISGQPDRMQDIRVRLFRELIDQTPWLDWLVLTKRPENILAMLPTRLVDDCPRCGGHVHDPEEWIPGRHPMRMDPDPCRECLKRTNVWLGTSVENQAAADTRIPELLKCRELSPVLFLSCEPLLGAVNLQCLQDGSWWDAEGATRYDALRGCAYWSDGEHGLAGGPTIDWVICGGESGPDARPMHTAWPLLLQDQCQVTKTPFFFKQWGEWIPSEQASTYQLMKSQKTTTVHGKKVHWVGKKHAGRWLDGRQWSQFPEGVPANG